MISKEATTRQKASTPTVSSNYKWWVVVMLWFICFFNYADRQMIFSVFPKFEQEFGFDTMELGLIASAFMWVYAFGAPFAGFIGDRVRRKDLILGGCVFWSLVTILTGKCSKLWHFVTVRALEGFGEAFYFPASMSLTSDYHGARTRSRALSFHQSSVYVGTILGSWLGAVFAEHYGWRVGFYIFGGAGLVLALLLYRFLREPRRGQAEANAPTAGAGVALGGAAASGASGNESSQDRPLTFWEIGPAILRKRTVWLLLAAFLGANFVATIFLTWTPTFLVKKFGFRLSSAGLSGAVFIHLASALSVPIGGFLADALSRRFGGGRMLVQACGLLAGSVFVFLVGSTGVVATLLISMSLFGLCKGLYDSNIFASLYDVVEPRARATAAGIMNLVGWGGGAVGPLFVGAAAKYGRHSTEVENMSEAIAFTGLIYLVSAALLILAAWTMRKSALSSSNP